MEQNEPQKPVIFISHSSKDKEDAKLLAKLLRDVNKELYDAKYEVYFAPDDMPRSQDSSSSTDEQILNKIKSASCVIVYYSPNAIYSRWVHVEVGAAISSEREIIPLLKTHVDCSVLINSKAQVFLDDTKCIKDLLSRIFKNDKYKYDIEQQGISSFEEQIQQLRYSLKVKRVYVVGNESLQGGKGRTEEVVDASLPTKTTSQKYDKLWDEGRARFFVEKITKALLDEGFLMASYPKVAPVGQIVAMKCWSSNHSDSYEIAGLYAFEDQLEEAMKSVGLTNLQQSTTSDEISEIVDKTIAQYRRSYLRHMDVQIIIGGNTNTYNEYIEAKKIKSLQIFPIPCFGGSGRKIYFDQAKQLNWIKYNHPCHDCDYIESVKSGEGEISYCPRINEFIERIREFRPFEDFIE